MAVDPSAFVTDDTAQQAAPPDPPDFARIIPISAIQDAKQQQVADQWMQQQQADLADQWYALHKNDLDSMVQDWQNGWQTGGGAASLGAPQAPETAAPPAEASSDQASASAGMMPSAEQPSQPPQNDVIQQFLTGLGGIVDKLGDVMTKPFIGQVPGVGEAIQGLAQQGAQTREAAFSLPNDQGQFVNPMTGNTYTPEQATEAAANLTSGAMSGDVEAGKAAAEAVGIAREALTADHPIVQQAAELAPPRVVNGVEHAVTPEGVANVIQSKSFDPAALEKASGRLDPTQTAALDAWKVAQNPDLAQAAMQRASASGTEAGQVLTHVPDNRPLFQFTDPTSGQPFFRDAAGNIYSAEAGAERSVRPPEAAPTPAEAPAQAAAASESAGPEIFNQTPTTPTATALPTPAVTEPSVENLAQAGVPKTPEQAKTVWDGISTVGTTLKQAVVAGGMLHPLMESGNLAVTGLATGKPLEAAKGIIDANHAFLSTSFAKGLAEANADVIAEAKANGAHLMDIGANAPDLAKSGYRIGGALFGGIGGFTQGFVSAKQQGKSTEEALGEGAIKGAAGAVLVGGIAPKFNENLWGNMVPVAKLEAYKLLRQAGYDAPVAAQRINNTFGGQGLQKLANAPLLQKIARTVFLAPDWYVSAAKNVADIGAAGQVGDAARKFWAAKVATAALMTEGINVALNGRPSWVGPDGKPDMNHALKTDVSKIFGQAPGSLYADLTMGGPVTSVANALLTHHPEEIVTGHLNVIPSMAVGAYNNDAFPSAQGQIVSAGTPAGQAALPEAAAAAGHMAPIPISTTNKQMPVPAQAASLATGITISPSTATKKAAAVNPAAPPVATRPRPTNLANTRSILTGPKAKVVNPAAPVGGGSNLRNTRSQLGQ